MGQVTNPTLAAGNLGNPTATIGLVTVNGVAVTAMRSDAAPALNQAITPNWSSNHTWLDNAEVRLGTGGDLRIYHDGINSFIRNDTGDLLFQEGAIEVARLMSAGYFRAATRVGAGVDPIVPFHGYRSGVNGAGTAACLVFDTDAKTANDGIGILLRGLNSGNVTQQYGFVSAGIVDPTAGAASGSIDFATINAGAGPAIRTRMMPGGAFAITDGITAPSTLAGFGQIYIDAADGDLKIIFSDGTVKTIVTD